MNYTYLIVGGGMTADAAVHGIREVDPNGSIGLLGADRNPPYDRPPLSKGLWKGKPLESVWRPTKGPGVTLHPERTARHLDPRARRVTDDQGTLYGYGKLLLATGGTPRRLPFGDGQIIYYRTLDDYQRLRELTKKGQDFAVIGGGFIGSEVAAALAMNGKKVVMAFPEAGIGARMFPHDLSAFLNDYFRRKGVNVLPGHLADGLDGQGPRATLKVRDAAGRGEHAFEVDGVVAGLGIQPNVELARAAGLEVGDGIHVDASLRTS
jgi:NADPH-dependent 2,4-dienoyl-CoA reductase/sulfur reductase-like enzyme